MSKDYPILDRSFDFAIQIIELYKILLERREYVISKQLLRSGTSIGANIEEAGAGQSKRDFIAKMSIASKKQEKPGIGYDYWIKANS